MPTHKRHMLGRGPAPPARAAPRVTASGEEIGGYIYMERVTSLSVTVDLDVDGVVQEGQTLMLLIDISSSIEKTTESLQVFHLNSMMSWRHVRHYALPIRS